MKYPIFSRQTLLTATCWTLAPLFFLFAAIGGIRFHTVVPVWDMWTGYLDFFVKASDGNWSAWWDFHNEHRIVLAHILFWIDLKLFQGSVWFLILVNYLLVFASFFTFTSILREQAGSEKNTKPVKLLALVIFMALFSWVQYDNLTWGFQSQFFLAQLIPLLALKFLHQSANKPDFHYFTTACILGILSIGTMANGVLALPIMVAYAVVLRMNWKKTGTLLLLTSIFLPVYFIGFQSPIRSDPVFQVATQNLFNIFQHFLAYLGSPFYYYTPGSRALLSAQIFGLILLTLSSIAAVRYIRRPQDYSLQLFLLAFILYIVGSALATAVGRSMSGIEQATTSRYTTPALMAWVALLIIYSPAIIKSLAKWQHRIVWPMMIIMLAMVPYQVKARKSHQSTNFSRELAALAMEMGVRDKKQIATTYWDPENSHMISDKPSERNLSIFGTPKFKDIRQTIGTNAGPLPDLKCTGTITEVSKIEKEKDYKKIKGWIWSTDGNNNFESIKIIDQNRIIVGYALMGDQDLSVQKTYGRKSKYRGFSGYILAKRPNSSLNIVAADSSCNVLVDPPNSPSFRSLPEIASISNITPSTGDVVENNNWMGKDYYQSTWPGIKVLGSFVTGDSDTGSITLRIKPGAAFMYRTGPDGRRQRIVTTGEVAYEGVLPHSTEWKTLVFDDPALTQEFTVKLMDEGSGWGEWSAIALLEKNKDSEKK